MIRFMPGVGDSLTLLVYIAAAIALAQSLHGIESTLGGAGRLVKVRVIVSGAVIGAVVGMVAAISAGWLLAEAVRHGLLTVAYAPPVPRLLGWPLPAGLIQLWTAGGAVCGMGCAGSTLWLFRPASAATERWVAGAQVDDAGRDVER